MCKYCPNSYGELYNFSFTKKVKRNINIAMYISLRNISHCTVHEQLYVVCGKLWRKGIENALIKGQLNTHPLISSSCVLCCVTGTIKYNCIVKPPHVEMLQIISERLKNFDI